MGSTGRSAAGVRVQFTSDANIRLSLHSLPVYRRFREEHGVDIGYRDVGYLLLVPPDRWDGHMEAVARQRRLGAPVEVLTPPEALRRVPFDPAGVAGATFGPWDGVIDPHLVTLAWVGMGREMGVAYHFSAPVRDIDAGDGVWGIRAGHRTLGAPFLVNAAGPWAGGVGRLAGLHVPVVPKRVQIFLSAPLETPHPYPMTIDTGSGVYLRSEGDRLLFGLDDPRQPPGFSEGMDWEWMEHVLVTGAKRFPWWEEMGVDRRGSWWGYYEVTPDHSPVIGFHPGAPGWIDACGFSGHGVMHAPATGTAVAELVALGEARTVPVAPFGHQRFLATAGGADDPGEENVF